MDETLREQIALFRFGVISEMVTRPLAPGEKERLLEAIGEKEWETPGTRRHRVGKTTAATWAGLYRAMGLEGLKPQPRWDQGVSRALPERVQELLLQLRCERPKASVVNLIRAVRLSGQVPPELRMAPSTVYRLLAAHGFEKPPPAAPSRMRRPSPTPSPTTCGCWTSYTVRSCSNPSAGGERRATSSLFSTTPRAWCPSQPSVAPRTRDAFKCH